MMLARIAQLATTLAITFAVPVVALGAGEGAPKERQPALLAAIEGPIGPATTRHVQTVLEEAERRNAAVVVFRINTPGGLATSMREIIAEILASPVAVVGFVAPSGAHAASAGTYILYATHVAAMAPGTNLGAATPVQIGGGLPAQPPDEERPRDEKPDSQEEKPSGARDQEPGKESPAEQDRQPAPADTMSAKATNDAVAFIRSLAELHGRNAEWAEEAVREAASLSAQAALQQGVIDLMAPDVETLLERLDGRRIEAGKVDTTLTTADASLVEIEADFLTRALSVLANPNVALILMLIGVYGLVFEFANPGSIGPGVVGSICLVLGLYALNQLPLDYAGLALIGLGVALMVAEAVTPSVGVLGIGGLVAFVIGAAMLIETESPQYQVSWPVIAVMAATSGLVLILLVGYVLRSHRRPVASGREQMVGAEALILDWSDGQGHVRTEGERWRALGADDFQPGQRVRVRALDGLTLQVDPLEEKGGRETGKTGGSS